MPTDHMTPCPRGGACGKGHRHDDRKGQLAECRRVAAGGSGPGAGAGSAPVSAAPPAPAGAVAAVNVSSSADGLFVDPDELAFAARTDTGVLVLLLDEHGAVARGGPAALYRRRIEDETAVLLLPPGTPKALVDAAERRLAEEDPSSDAVESRWDAVLEASKTAASHLGVDLSPAATLEATGTPVEERYRPRRADVEALVTSIDLAIGRVSRSLRVLHESYDLVEAVPDDVGESWNALHDRERELRDSRRHVEANERPSRVSEATRVLVAENRD